MSNLLMNGLISENVSMNETRKNYNVFSIFEPYGQYYGFDISYVQKQAFVHHLIEFFNILLDQVPVGFNSITFFGLPFFRFGNRQLYVEPKHQPPEAHHYRLPQYLNKCICHDPNRRHWHAH